MPVLANGPAGFEGLALSISANRLEMRGQQSKSTLLHIANLAVRIVNLAVHSNLNSLDIDGKPLHIELTSLYIDLTSLRIDSNLFYSDSKSIDFTLKPLHS